MSTDSRSLFGPLPGGVRGEGGALSRAEGLPRPRTALPRMVILTTADGARVVWTVIPPSGAVSNAGWQRARDCSHTLYQWAGPSRPASVRCPRCGKWSVAP